MAMGFGILKQMPPQPQETHLVRVQSQSGYTSSNTPCTSSSVPVATTSSITYGQPTTPSLHVQTTKANLWENAKALLSDKERRFIERKTGGFLLPVSSAVNEMIDLATRKQAQCTESKWNASLCLGGHDISLSDGASRVIGVYERLLSAVKSHNSEKHRPVELIFILIWLNKFKEIGDIIIQYDPTHAALPWAAVLFILQATIASEEEMLASIAILDRATRIIHRCQVYEELYNRTTVDHDVVQNFEATLTRLYAFVLRGLIETKKFLSKSTPSRSLYAILHPGTGAGLLTTIEEGESQVLQEVQVCEGYLRAKADGKHQEQLHGLLQLAKPILRADENITRVLEQLKADEQTRILQWISPIEFRKHHALVKESRTKDTCHWLLKRPKFIQWSSATSSITLWLHGFPGAGKTYLTSKIIDEVDATLTTGIANDEGFAFFYCNRNEESRRTALEVLRSYVRQLSTTPQKSKFIHSQLKQLYADCQLKGSGWTLGLCREYLTKLLNLYPRTILTLDALDECHPEERWMLLDFFDSIPSRTSKPVRIFISSRPEGDIRQRLIHLPRIEIRATDNELDIAKFVAQDIERSGRWSDALKQNQNLKKEIVETLLNQSDGMFQWAMLQIKQLLNLRSETEIRSRLGKLPRGLKAAYDEIFANIEGLEDYARISTFRALRWLMCAYHPLQQEALLAAIRIDTAKRTLGRLKPTESDVLDWCANLLWMDVQQYPPVWRVTHLSVVEYLETRWTMLETHCFVAEACLVSLLEIHGGTHKTENNLGHGIDSNIIRPNHPFQSYVNHHWIRHVQTQETGNANPNLSRLLKDFLGSLDESSVSYFEWHRSISNPLARIPRSSAFKGVLLKQISPRTSPILLACRFSLHTLLIDWWNDPLLGTSQLADSGDHLLALAAAGGSEPICLKLIQLGMSVNAFCRDRRGYDSALGAAADEQRFGIVQLLVDNGAKINAAIRSGAGSALAIAASRRSLPIVRFLVEAGADVDIVPPFQNGNHNYGSPLAAAAKSGSLETVQFLVDQGANINMLLENGECGSALAAATYSQSMDIVSYLVRKGADINMLLRGGDYGDALAAAAHCGSFEIVQFLIANGADVNSLLQAGRFGSALIAGILRGSYDIMHFLIKQGANVNLQLKSGIYGSALAAVATLQDDSSLFETIDVLIDHGADINMELQGGIYGSALAAAAASGIREGDRSHVIEYLIRKGADVNLPLRYGIYGSALAAAVTGGDDTLNGIRLLIDAGADINQQLHGGFYGSALAAAVDGGWELECLATVECLVERGANIHMPLSIRGDATALEVAESRLGKVRLRTEIKIFVVEKGGGWMFESGDFDDDAEDAELVLLRDNRMVETIQLLIEKGGKRASLPALITTTAQIRGHLT
ncbi:hypothetical protein GGR57DRAFT_517591 [Xylariaceae sp. FL1272]|nr:hypothetical protein GGR57DRAFT_517591 [Xylariaceae sp. FL1272]